MKTKFSKEILLHSLPDYISDRIEDSELKKEIEREIQNNPEFKTEYNEISGTLNFLNTTNFESPQENYFNNLSVKINEKLNSEEIPESIWDKLGLFGKIFVSAISIIIIAIFIYNFMNNDQTETIVSQAGIENNNSDIKNDIKKNAEPVIDTKNDKMKAKSNEMTDPRYKQKNTARKNDQTADTQDIAKNTEDIVFSDENTEASEEDEDEMLSNFMADNNTEITGADTEEDILFLKDDEENFEEELLDFTPEEQKEIIENLNKTKI